MDVKISTGNYDIINSGTIVGNVNEPIEFVIQTLTFIIEFRTNASTAGSSIEKEVINDKSLKIILINFNSSIGTRNINPMSIGNISNRKLFFNFSAYSLSDKTGHIFHYSFILEKEAKNGE